MRVYWARLVVLLGLFSFGPVPVALADGVRGPVVTAEGYILIAVDHDGDGAGFRSRLKEPSQALSIHLGLVEFSYEEAGECHEVLARVNRGGQDSTTRTRRCPTADGWKETLVQSTLYEDYEVLWTVYEADGKTQLQWELKALIPGVAPIILNYHMGEEMRKALRSLGASK